MHCLALLCYSRMHFYETSPAITTALHSALRKHLALLRRAELREELALFSRELVQALLAGLGVRSSYSTRETPTKHRVLPVQT